MVMDIFQRVFFAFYITDANKYGAFRVAYTLMAIGFFAQLLIISAVILVDHILSSYWSYKVSPLLVFIFLQILTFGSIYLTCLKLESLDSLIKKQSVYVTTQNAERIKIIYAVCCFSVFLFSVWFGF